MDKARILVVDDSAVFRKIISKSLSADEALEVAGTAANGKIAIAKIPQINPDLITLDVEMPEMDGLQTLAIIRQKYPDLPIIMFSAITERAASITLEALRLGARDYVTKPSQIRNINDAFAQIKNDLNPKVKALCPTVKNISTRIHWPSAIPGATQKRIIPRKSAPVKANIEILAIGVSTGGPNALAKIIPCLPPDFPVPIVIVQHMPPTFTGILAKSLSKQSRIEVGEGFDGAVLKPGKAWIAPGNFHMTIGGNLLSKTLELNQDSPENSCRPAVDTLFRSVARTYGASSLSIVLTGMGKDGLRGAGDIINNGGRVFVQDEESSVVWGMPGYVAEAGLAEKILPLDQIAPAILREMRKKTLTTFSR